uniref:Uncharacterized protein n=1 Tax=Fagus sylvatica TaxID=28930 RepID=A0A2N9F6Q6_FAGSY
MASSSSQNKPETINLNDTPSVMPEVWRPYFLSINGPVSVTDSVILNGETATAVAAGLCTPEDAKEYGSESAAFSSHHFTKVAEGVKQSKTTNKLQKQYEKLLAEVKELTSRSIP